MKKRTSLLLIAAVCTTLTASAFGQFCGDPEFGDCCIANGTPGCEVQSCCDVICRGDPFCCDTAWDQICADAALNTDSCFCPWACCFKDGACLDLTAVDCAAQGGTPGGAGSSCATTICTQACCLPDACVELSVDDCIAQGGTPGGAGSSCATPVCNQACCLLDECIDLNADECTAQGGTPKGVGTTCAAFPCDDEETVQNDSLIDGNSGTTCHCFVPGESAAAWLTSPCDGAIVAVQIFWRSQFGGGPSTTETGISIFGDGEFPEPGAVLVNQDNSPAVITSPTLSDGTLNEFRYLDGAKTIPLGVPIASGATFVVSLEVVNQSSGDIFAPTFVYDLDGCQANRNAVNVMPGGWIDACAVGVTGDWMIRAVVECGSCLGDLDGDGNVNAADLAILLGDWGPYGPCPPYVAGDIQQDCDVDAADLAELLGAWGPCP